MVEFNNNSYSDGRYPENTKATFSCAETFQVNGVQEVDCQKSSNWSHAPGICNKIGKDIILLARLS